MGSTFLLLLQPTASQTRRNILLSSDLSDGREKKKTKKKNLLNEETSKEASVADIDHILWGPQYTTGSASLQLRAFFTAYIRFFIPRTACCLAVSSLGDWTAPQCFLSIPRVRGRKVGLPSYCLRHQPPILQERGGQQRTFKRNT